jgi:hypothetical protein
VKLFFRFPNGGADSVESAWNSLASADVPPSLADATVVFQQEAYPPKDCIAQAEVRFEDDVPRGIVRFSTSFLTKGPPEQRLTLLHELIHVHLLSGPCRCRMERASEIKEQYKRYKRKTVDGQAFEFEQVGLAKYLYTFADEVMAEKYLSVTTPAFAEQRIQQYATMQATSWDAGEQDGGRPEVRGPRLLVLWLRNQLGVPLARDETQAAFEQRANVLAERLKEVLSVDECDRVMGLARRVLAAAHDGSSWDENAANELFDWVIGIEYVPTAE